MATKNRWTGFNSQHPCHTKKEKHMIITILGNHSNKDLAETAGQLILMDNIVQDGNIANYLSNVSPLTRVRITKAQIDNSDKVVILGETDPDIIDYVQKEGKVIDLDSFLS